MSKYAVLIDAGFLKRKIGSRDKPLAANTVEAFINNLDEHPSLKELVLHRVYFYDAPPLQTAHTKPLGGGTMDFSNTPLAQNNRRLHLELQSVPFVALRMGLVRFRGWSVKPRFFEHKHTNQSEVSIGSNDIIPNVQQKGVDMRIGLDIASLTLKGHVQVVVLVTSDSDFIPAMKFARREGAQLFLVPLGHSILPDMREHSDLILNLAAWDQGRRP